MHETVKNDALKAQSDALKSEIDALNIKVSKDSLRPLLSDIELDICV